MAAPLPPPPPPPNPPPIALPAQPNDPNVPLPAAPVFPPTVNDVLRAVKFHQNVDVSIAERPPAVRCNSNDLYNSVLYEHGIVAQAVAVAGPQAVAPPWFQGAIQQLRMDLQNDVRGMILPDLKRLMNQRRGDGDVVAFEVVPFPDGRDPTLPPNNLPALRSVDVIEHLHGQELVQYLTGYGVALPVGPNPHANRLQKETLKNLVGAQS